MNLGSPKYQPLCGEAGVAGVDGVEWLSLAPQHGGLFSLPRVQELLLIIDRSEDTK